MDNAFESYSDRIIEAIQDGNLICIFFPRLGKTMIMDFRSTDTIPPAIMIDRMVSNAHERLESLQQMRPDLGVPDEVRLAPWMGFLSSMDDSGVLQAMLQRCETVGGDALSKELRQAIRELMREERQIVRDIILGHTSRAIWQRPES